MKQQEITFRRLTTESQGYGRLPRLAKHETRSTCGIEPRELKTIQPCLLQKRTARAIVCFCRFPPSGTLKKSQLTTSERCPHHHDRAILSVGPSVFKTRDSTYAYNDFIVRKEMLFLADAHVNKVSRRVRMRHVLVRWYVCSYSSVAARRRPRPR